MALDPVLMKIVDQLPVGKSEVMDYEAERRNVDALLEVVKDPDGPIEVKAVEDRQIDTAAGSVALRIFRPKVEAVGTLQFIHGGGWVLGGIEFVDALARRLARDLSMVVVTNAYRLAPENPFPAGFDDCLAAALWVLEHKSQLGGADKPVVIGGESAGGNLAAAIALSLRDTENTNFHAQLLFFPVVDARESAKEYPSRKMDADPFLTTAAMAEFSRLYCAESELEDPRVSPLAAERLDNLPPALVVVLTVDPLRDEAVVYADRMRASGGKADLLEFDHLVHGFPGFSALVPAADEATAVVIDRFNSLMTSDFKC